MNTTGQLISGLQMEVLSKCGIFFDRTDVNTFKRVAIAFKVCYMSERSEVSSVL